MWLQEKYLKMFSCRLKLFKPKKKGVYNCRCPICGDSQKNKTKARGYFYTRKNELFYDCKNCGSPDHRTFDKFLKWFDVELYKEYRMELFKESMHSKSIIKPVKITFNYNKPKQREIPEILSHLKSIQKLGAGHVVYLYANARCIPKNRFEDIYFASSMNVFSELIIDYAETRFDEIPRMILPFIDKDGIVTHIQGRAIDDAKHTSKSNRYITLELVQDTTKVFGMNTIDDTQTIKVVEGPIDSLFLKNCVAMAGADIDFGIFDKDNTIFIFDNEPRNIEIIKRMESVIDKGFGVCIWGSEIESGDDINDLILKNFTANELNAYVESRTFRGLKAKMKLSKYKKI